MSVGSLQGLLKQGMPTGRRVLPFTIRPMHRLSIKTQRKRQILDITDPVEALLRQHHAAAVGVCHLLVLHTTAALTTADLDPGTDLDMLDAFESMIPKLNYRHPHDPGTCPTISCRRSSAPPSVCWQTAVRSFWGLGKG